MTMLSLLEHERAFNSVWWEQMRLNVESLIVRGSLDMYAWTILSQVGALIGVPCERATGQALLSIPSTTRPG